VFVLQMNAVRREGIADAQRAVRAREGLGAGGVRNELAAAVARKHDEEMLAAPEGGAATPSERPRPL
jgi:hypothetical protein